MTWGAREGHAAGAPPPPQGKTLGKLSGGDLKAVVERALVVFSRENRDLDILVFREVLDHVARLDRVLTQPGGSVLLAGRSGVGRRTAATLVAHMHNMQLFVPKTSRGYGLKHFKSDLKTCMQQGGLEGEQVLLLIEDHQLTEPQFLELTNSLLSSGEVPGLYSPEELEPLLVPLRDLASEAGHRGPVANFFAQRVLANLHVALIMDCTNSTFTVTCESNPALHKRCAVQWMDGWSRESMFRVPHLLLTRPPKQDGARLTANVGESRQRKLSGGDALLKALLQVHDSAPPVNCTPRRYLSFVRSYESVYNAKKTSISTRQQHLQVFLSLTHLITTFWLLFCCDE